MVSLLADILYKNVVVYVNDIGVLGKNGKEIVANTDEVFTR